MQFFITEARKTVHQKNKPRETFFFLLFSNLFNRFMGEMQKRWDDVAKY